MRHAPSISLPRGAPVPSTAQPWCCESSASASGRSASHSRLQPASLSAISAGRGGSARLKREQPGRVLPVRCMPTVSKIAGSGEHCTSALTHSALPPSLSHR